MRRLAIVPDSSEGPTVLRILLGTHLRRLREARGITARQAATAIRASESKISRMELGRNAIREIDVLDLLTSLDRARVRQHGADRTRRGRCGTHHQPGAAWRATLLGGGWRRFRRKSRSGNKAPAEYQDSHRR